MTSRRRLRPDPHMLASEESTSEVGLAGMARRRSPRFHPQINSSEDVAGMARRRSSPRLHPQIQVGEEGAGVSRRSSPHLHPQIRSGDEGAGVTRRRRRRGTSPATSASLPDDDDMLREIFLRLPPEPSSLLRASAVCKRWRGLVADPRFLRHFHAHHRKPPLLGFFERGYMGILFTPILGPPDRITPERFDLGRYSRQGLYNLLDCRHGLVLINDGYQNAVAVCNPITGEQRCMAIPSELIRTSYLEGAVLCAAGDHGHVHGYCQLSSYKVVLLSIGRSDTRCLACVYSLETGMWDNLISIEVPFDLFYAHYAPATLVGNCLYWSKGNHILEFDLDRQNLAVIMGPPGTKYISTENCRIIQAAEGSVFYAMLSYPRFEMWQRNINGQGVATWVLWKTIEMHTIHGLPTPHEGMYVKLLGYDEDDAVFLCYGGSVFMVQLKLMRSRKLNEIRSTMNRYFPFKSFFTPGTNLAGGFNGAEMLNIG